MTIRLAFGLVVLAPAAACADVMLFANDYAGFVQAAGPLSIIDFETRPDGLPWNGNEIINDSFNYDGQGVHFSAPLGNLIIGGNEIIGFDLRVTVPSGKHTWITSDLITPAYAVGAFFPGDTTLCAYDDNQNLLGCVFFGGGGENFFVGIVTDTPIARATFDSGFSSESIQAFVFSPIPEPTSAMLLAAGLVWLFDPRRALRRTRHQITAAESLVPARWRRRC